ncbi:undecaprenyl/decaprenyl-phosphate alpha-N-acetylglucosaminyl 1-phosphate transferase [Candidatus Nomurabacteria bacterium]|nr:undecaprenyl/decaprenyl-phosphate alpha-N-acetylglucosaminyl 1-phosphate transferase [Candidatus Nomurabacteria bacterium]
MSDYLGFGIFAFTLSFFCTFCTIWIMQKFQIVDKPKTDERKRHKKTTPLGGGIAIFVSFFVMMLLATKDGFLGQEIGIRSMWGMFLGGCILMLGGIVDDKYNLPAKYQIIAPIFAALTILWFGIGPHQITNPWGGVVDLSGITISVGALGNIVLFADILVFAWLMGMMFTTKFLDGLDGLVSGVVIIGAGVLFFLSRQPEWYQSEMAMISIIFAGAVLGFLVFNFHPAKIFLGEGGSLFLGFVLGCLAILSGGKIATTLLVVGVPALDVLRVIIRRFQKQKSIFVGDREHLHYLLVDMGFGHRQTVYLLYGISLLLGMSALFLQSRQKLLALVLIFVLMLLIGVWFSAKDKEKTNL